MWHWLPAAKKQSLSLPQHPLPWKLLQLSSLLPQLLLLMPALPLTLPRRLAKLPRLLAKLPSRLVLLFPVQLLMLVMLPKPLLMLLLPLLLPLLPLLLPSKLPGFGLSGRCGRLPDRKKAPNLLVGAFFWLRCFTSGRPPVRARCFGHWQRFRARRQH